MNKKLVSVIIMQICFTWVVAQDGDGNITTPGELAHAEVSEQPETNPTNSEVQSDQAASPAAPVVTDDVQQQKLDETTTTVIPTHAPNFPSTSAPPLVHRNATSDATTPVPSTTTKKPNKGNSVISGANFAIIVIGASALRFFY